MAQDKNEQKICAIWYGTLPYRSAGERILFNHDVGVGVS